MSTESSQGDTQKSTTVVEAITAAESFAFQRTNIDELTFTIRDRAYTQKGFRWLNQFVYREIRIKHVNTFSRPLGWSLIVCMILAFWFIPKDLYDQPPMTPSQQTSDSTVESSNQFVQTPITSKLIRVDTQELNSILRGFTSLTKDQNTKNREFFSVLCFPLLAACATFCITLAGRISNTAMRIRDLSKSFGENIKPSTTESRNEESDSNIDLVRCSTIIIQMRFLQSRYRLARLSFTSKIFGIFCFVLMELCAYSGHFLSAYGLLFVGLWMLATGLILSVFDIFLGGLAMEREMVYIDHKYHVAVERLFTNRKEDWMEGPFKKRVEMWPGRKINGR